MASFIAKFVTKKILGETIQNKFGTEDPYFEYIPATRLDGSETGKLKKRKKALPPGISKRDGQVLTKVKRRAYRLDLALFSCCGIRFGWGSAIGFIPAIGDVLDALMALMVLRTCEQIEGGLPTTVKTRMMINIVIDFVIGLVPFVGDLADAAFRANTRNVVLLEEHLRKTGIENLKKSGQPVPAVDPSDPDDFDRLQASDPPEYASHPPSRNPSMDARIPTSGGRVQPVEPEPAKVRESRGWFGWNRSRPVDPEMGREPEEPPVRSQRSQRQNRRDRGGRDDRDRRERRERR